MSRSTIGLVTEGGTDYDLLCALLGKWFGPEVMFICLQPADSSTENGSGWKGVRRWCQQTIGEYGSLRDYCDAIEPRLDGIVLQVDGDVVFEQDVELDAAFEGETRERRLVSVGGSKYDRFPLEAKGRALHALVSDWLSGKDAGLLALCVPIDELETWIVAAYDSQTYHRPPDYPIEALVLPADSVIGHAAEYHGIRVHRRDGRLKKNRSVFRNFHSQVTTEWKTVASVCSMASVFEDEVMKALGK
jgi:hypothetical protein